MTAVSKQWWTSALVQEKGEKKALNLLWGVFIWMSKNRDDFFPLKNAMIHLQKMLKLWPFIMTKTDKSAKISDVLICFHFLSEALYSFWPFWGFQLWIAYLCYMHELKFQKSFMSSLFTKFLKFWASLPSKTTISACINTNQFSLSAL